MDTVSYLTINDETKEIADVTSRSYVENIAAVVSAQGSDIEYLQYETGPGGSLLNSIDDVRSAANTAQTKAESATQAAAIANEKASSAGQAADRA